MVYGWANESLKAVKSGADSAVTFFQGLYVSTVQTYSTVRAKINETAHHVHDRAVQTTDKAGKVAGAASKNVMREANEAARIYQEAEREIIRKYVKAQNHLHTELMNRWDRSKI